MKAQKPTFGWVMQPALFETPAGVRAGDIEIARRLVAANDLLVARAEEFGFSHIWVEDHMEWEDKAHLECFTNLAWLAGRHPNLHWGTMVCGQGFRNPAYLAKLAANLHVLTGGRFLLGVGAGNNDGEHRRYGYQFGPPAERLARLEEVIQVLRALWSTAPASFEGQYHRIEGAYCSPLPDTPIPLVIGGGGERKTLRLVAEYADWWCADVGTVATFVHKSQVLDRHMESVDRPRESLVRSQVTWVSIEDDPARVVRWPNLHIVAGSPDEVRFELQAFLNAGVTHFQMRFMDYPDPGGMERFARSVMPYLRVPG